jgi:hypothetical protein
MALIVLVRACRVHMSLCALDVACQSLVLKAQQSTRPYERKVGSQARLVAFKGGHRYMLPLTQGMSLYKSYSSSSVYTVAAQRTVAYV